MANQVSNDPLVQFPAAGSSIHAVHIMKKMRGTQARLEMNSAASPAPPPLPLPPSPILFLSKNSDVVKTPLSLRLNEGLQSLNKEEAQPFLLLPSSSPPPS